jgi:hypothetical protein
MIFLMEIDILNNHFIIIVDFKSKEVTKIFLKYQILFRKN